MRSKIRTKQRIIIGNVAWGHQYIENLFNYSLETLITSSNFKKISTEYIIHFCFVTNDESVMYIEKYLQNLSNEYQITSKIIVLNSINRSRKIDKIVRNVYDKYQIHSLATQQILNEVNDNDFLVFNYSDFIWTSGSFVRIIELLKDPTIDVVSCHPLTLNSNSPAVKNMISSASSKTISQEEVVKLSITHSAWWYDQYTWGNNKASDYLSLIYFPIDDSSYLFRGFHIHPLAFKGKNHNGEKLPKLEFGTLDGVYLPRVLQRANWNNYFIQNQKEVCIGALSGESSASYTGVERNFVKKLIDHVLKTHNRQEIDNSKYFSIISNTSERTKDIERVIEISRLNIENAISLNEIGLAKRDYEYLIKQRQIYENLENLTDQKFRVLILILLILRIGMDCTIRFVFLMVRFIYRLKNLGKHLLIEYIFNNSRRVKSILLNKIQDLFGTRIVIPNGQDTGEYNDEKESQVTPKDLDAINESYLNIRPLAKAYFEFLVVNHRRNKYERP